MSDAQYDLTTNYQLKKPRPQADGDAWGGHTNDNWDSVDTLIAGAMNKDLAVTQLGAVSTPTLTVNMGTVRVYAMVIASSMVALSLTTTAQPGTFSTGLLVITQDAIGSRDIAWPANFRWQGGFAPSLSIVPGATDILQVSTIDGGVTWFAAIALQAPP